jgi:hypothetical protein
MSYGIPCAFIAPGSGLLPDAAAADLARSSPDRSKEAPERGRGDRQGSPLQVTPLSGDSERGPLPAEREQRIMQLQKVVESPAQSSASGRGCCLTPRPLNSCPAARTGARNLPNAGEGTDKAHAPGSPHCPATWNGLSFPASASQRIMELQGVPQSAAQSSPLGRGCCGTPRPHTSRSAARTGARKPPNVGEGTDKAHPCGSPHCAATRNGVPFPLSASKESCNYRELWNPLRSHRLRGGAAA